MLDTDRIVIVGGGLAGLRTAERLRRLDHRGPVTLVTGEDHLPYDRPPLSKALLTQDDDPAGPVLLRDHPAYDELDLDLRIGRRAIRLDTGAREVHLDDGTTVGYYGLVIATGATAREIPAFAGAAGVVTLRTWEDCLALRGALRGAGHVTVVGAGVLGCEVAASARAVGREVTVVEGLPHPLARAFGPLIGGVVADLHREEGVDLRCSVQVEALTPGPNGLRVRLTDGTSVETGLVVVAVGATPNTEWLDGSGVAIDDGVLCASTGATSAEGVFAAGDAARMPPPTGDGTVRLEHWTNAVDTAALVAENLLAEPGARRSLTEVPYFWSDQYAAKIQSLGLPDPSDEVTVVHGSLEERRFLAVSHHNGRVTGAASLSMPGPLNRCRAAVAARTPLTDLLATTPWVRRPTPR